MVLTGYGKELLTHGALQFVYWSAFDNEVDYDPYVSASGSLSEDVLESQIAQLVEDSLVQEATTGYKRLNNSGSDTTNVFRPMFDMPQGQVILPQVTSSAPTDATLEVKQRKVTELLIKRDQNGVVLEQMGPYDRGYERFESSHAVFEYGYAPGSFPSDSKLGGFLVRVFQSGSEGLVEVDQRRDLDGNLSFNNDLMLVPLKGGK